RDRVRPFPALRPGGPRGEGARALRQAPLSLRDRGPARQAPAHLQAGDRGVSQRGQEEPRHPQPRHLADRRSRALPRHARRLPEQNRANVFARMQAERGKIAMKYRSEGEREFKKVVAEAEREKTRILAEAYREAERAKGAGDAEAMRIYAEAFGKNPQLYKFRRTLQAYEKILDGSTTVFLPADAEIFRMLGTDNAPRVGR